MRKTRRILALALAVMACCLALLNGAALAEEKPTLMMATTTSTDDTGLLDYLAPLFTKDTGIDLRWTATGTGKALELGRNCDVDVLLVHAPAAELQFVEKGFGQNRREIMYNDFVLIGPATDPAGVRGKSTPAAFSAIAAQKVPFISRGDKSGTHQKELEIWKSTAFQPEKDPWYVQTGQGMIATINVAAEKNGYTLTDRGTFIKYESDKGGKPPLVILVQGDAPLRNQYSVIEVSPKHCDKVKNELARKYADWMAGPRGQKQIAEFKLRGKQLFYPDAK